MDINLPVIKNQEFIAKKLESVCRGVLSFVPGIGNTLILPESCMKINEMGEIILNNIRLREIEQ